MTIEEKAIHAWGVTEIPELAVWMTKDGTMINGSYEGWQRDIDHREVSQFYSKSKFVTPGSAAIYLYKFMRRGNIRMGCSEYGYCMESAGKPTPAQLGTLAKILEKAERNGIETGIRITDGHGNGKMHDLGIYLEGKGVCHMAA